MERGEFASQALEHGIDGGGQQAIIACFKLRDFRPQPLSANVNGCQIATTHTRQLATACINAAILIVEKLENVSDIA